MDDEPDVHRVLFGAAAELTGPGIAALTHTEVDRNRELWRALGFPVPPDDEPVHAADALGALEALDRLERTGLLDDEDAVRLTRSIGRALAGVARAQAEVLEQVALAQGVDPSALLPALADVLPDLEALIVFVWRRHLSSAVADVVAAGRAGSRRHTAVGFVDLTGFTTMAREHPPEVVRHVIRTFEARVTDAVSDAGGRVISTLGDAVLFTVSDVTTAAQLCLTLAELPAADAELLPLRVGLAYGEVVSHHGDVLGPVVNLAARLCEVARPGTVLVDREAAALLQDAPALVLRRVGRANVRGYAHLEPWALRRAEP